MVVSLGVPVWKLLSGVGFVRAVARIFIRRGYSFTPSLPYPFLLIPSFFLSPPFPSLSFLPFHLSFPLLSPMIQLRGLGARCKLPQRVRLEPGRQTIFGEFRAYNQAPDNNHFDWIFNQLTVKGLHKLIYIERPLNLENTDWKSHRIFFVIISEGFEPITPPKYGPVQRYFLQID